MRIESVRVMPERVVSAGSVIAEERSGTMPSWVFTRWVFQRRMAVRSVRVVAEAYPVTMVFFGDGELGAMGTVVVADGQPVRVAAPLNGTEVLGLEFAFVDALGAAVDLEVSRVEVWMQEVAEVAELFPVSNPGSARGLRWRWAGQAAEIGAVWVDATAWPVHVALRQEGSETVVWETDVEQMGYVAVGRGLGTAWGWEVDAYIEDVAAPPIEGEREQIRALRCYARVERPARGEYLWSRAGSAGARWLWERLAFEQDKGLSSVRVRASSYPLTMQLFKDGATDATAEVEIEGDYEHYVGMETARTLDVAFVDALGNAVDERVSSVDLWLAVNHEARGHVPIGAVGRWRCHWFRAPEAASPAVICVKASAYTGLVARLIGSETTFKVRPQDGSGATLNGNPSDGDTAWRLDLENPAQHEIYGVSVYFWIRSAVGPGPQRIPRGPGEVAPWRYTEYAWPGQVAMGSVRLDADTATAVTVLGRNDDVGVAYPSAQGEAAFTGQPVDTVWRVSAGSGDPRTAGIRALTLFPVEHIVVGNRGLIVPAGKLQSWKNKRLAFKESGKFVVARIVARAYPVTLTLGAMAAVTIADGEEVRLADAAEAREWGLDVDPAQMVDEVYLLGESVKKWSAGSGDPRTAGNPRTAGGGARWTREEEPWSWMGLVARGAGTFAPSRWRCVAAEYPIRAGLRKDGVWVQDLVAGGPEWQVLPVLGVAREWGLDVEAGEAAGVTEVGMR